MINIKKMTSKIIKHFHPIVASVEVNENQIDINFRDVNHIIGKADIKFVTKLGYELDSIFNFNGERGLTLVFVRN